MNAFITIIIALIQAIIPALLKESKPTVEDGSRAPVLRDKLRAKIRGTWGSAGAGILLLGLLVGCETHSVYVPDGTPVRLRETVANVKVWVLDAEGIPVASRMDLPEGWYVLPLDEEKPPSDDG